MKLWEQHDHWMHIYKHCLNSSWFKMTQLTDLEKHEKDHKSANFTNIEQKLYVIVAKHDPHHILLMWHIA